MINFSGISLDSKEIINFLKRDLSLERICQGIICQRIISRVAQEHEIVVVPDEIQAELGRFCIEKNLSSPSQLSFWLSEQMIDLSELEQKLYENLLASKVSKKLFSGQIQTLFSQNQSDFEQILLYKIAVPYQSLAQELFYQIEEEEISFYEAAHLYDLDERRRLQCGYEGRQQRSMLRPEISELLFNANIGEVVGPSKAAENIYELFLVDDFFPARLTPELQEELLGQLFQEWLDNELALYVSQQI